MIKLSELKLIDILPDRLKTNREIVAIANALEKELQEITETINEVIIMSRIDEMPEEVVDSLAWQLHVDFYEPLALGLDLDKKRALVKNSLDWHRRKGTKSVLEDMIRILFLDDVKIEEWFEYGGKPYFFRIISYSDSLTDEQYNDLIRAIHQLKNERSWLEEIIFIRKIEATIHTGQVARRTRRFILDGISPKLAVESAVIHIGTVGRRMRKFVVDAISPKLAANSVVYIDAVGRNTRRFTIGCTKEEDI